MHKGWALAGMATLLALAAPAGARPRLSEVVAPCVCTPRDVGVHLDPPLLFVAPGTTKPFTVTVTNNDSPECDPIRVELSPGSGGGPQCPSGLVDEFLDTNQFVTIAPGETIQFKDFVIVAPSASQGYCYEDFFVYALRESDTITEYLVGDSAVIFIPTP